MSKYEASLANKNVNDVYRVKKNGREICVCFKPNAKENAENIAKAMNVQVEIQNLKFKIQNYE